MQLNQTIDCFIAERIVQMKELIFQTDTANEKNIRIDKYRWVLINMQIRDSRNLLSDISICQAIVLNWPCHQLAQEIIGC